jgi:pimeloyl-ACP methyl ester carboxylesterase
MGWHATHVRVPSRDGVELAVHDLGGGDHGRPPLLLAHATGLLARAYQPLADRLTDAFHVWGVDLRAHGESTTPENGDLSWPRMADDVLAVVDELTPPTGRPYAVGHSMGGAALVLAELARPGTFERLYLYEPVLIPAGLLPAEAEDNPMSAAARRRRPSFETRASAYENYAGKPPLDEMSEASLQAYVEHGLVDQADGTVALACTPDHEAETFAGAAVAGAFERLAEVACPVVVARGSLDSPGPAGFAEQAAAALPHGTLVVLDGLGHFGPLADEDAVARSIREAFAPGT